MTGRRKRIADVPDVVLRLGSAVSKADLLEAAYWLAAASGESCDDEQESFKRLFDEVNLTLERHGRSPLKITPLLAGRSMRRLEQEAESIDEVTGRSRS